MDLRAFLNVWMIQTFSVSVPCFDRVFVLLLACVDVSRFDFHTVFTQDVVIWLITIHCVFFMCVCVQHREKTDLIQKASLQVDGSTDLCQYWFGFYISYNAFLCPAWKKLFEFKIIIYTQYINITIQGKR